MIMLVLLRLAAALASAAAVASDEDINQSAVRTSDSGVETAVEQVLAPQDHEDDVKISLNDADTANIPVAAAAKEEDSAPGSVDVPQAARHTNEKSVVADDGTDEEYVYLPTKDHVEYPVDGLSRDSLVAGGVEMPRIFFTSPLEGEVLRSSDVSVGLAVEPANANLRERNIVMCLELLFRHGKTRSCFNDLTDVEMNGVESGQLLAIATLELNATADGPHARRNISKDTRSISVLVDVKPAKIGITFPRTEEHLSIQYVGVAVRLDGFEKDDGIVCMTITKDIEVNEQGEVTRVGESADVLAADEKGNCCFDELP